MLEYKKLTPENRGLFLSNLTQLSKNDTNSEDFRARNYLLGKTYKGSQEFEIWDDSTLIGFYSTLTQGSDLYLGWIYFFEEFRKKGFGKKTIEKLILESNSQNLNRIICRVKEDNRKAQDFYFNLGFREVISKDGEIIFEKVL